MVATWLCRSTCRPLHGGYVVVALHLQAVTWWLRGGAAPPAGRYMVATLWWRSTCRPLHGGYVAATWWLRGGYVVVALHLPGLKEGAVRRHFLLQLPPSLEAATHAGCIRSGGWLVPMGGARSRRPLGFVASASTPGPPPSCARVGSCAAPITRTAAIPPRCELQRETGTPSPARRSYPFHIR